MNYQDCEIAILRNASTNQMNKKKLKKQEILTLKVSVRCRRFYT